MIWLWLHLPSLHPTRKIWEGAPPGDMALALLGHPHTHWYPVSSREVEAPLRGVSLAH